MKILFGTTNQGKLTYMRNVLKDFNVSIIGLNDLDIFDNVEETGDTPIENAEIKARHYYNQVNIPTFSIDSGLWLDKFDEDMQPGVNVRRVGGKILSDEELLNHMISEIDKIGGESLGHFHNGICLIINDKIYKDTIIDTWVFKSIANKKRIKGEPLTSIQYHPITNDSKVILKTSKNELINMEVTEKFKTFFEAVFKDL